MKIELGFGELTVKELCRLAEGELFGDGDRTFSFVCTDSREADEKTLFVAIRGERVDGHDYISAAYKNGCRCVLCEQQPVGIDGISAVLVTDSVKALSKIARNACENKDRLTVAITGSVGKTTTKEYVAAALLPLSPYRTEGNFNSVIGLPLSMLGMKKDTRSAVLEMGMSGFYEIDAMSRAARPDVAIITNIGSSHMEMLGSRENIRLAKLEIVNGLKENGILLVNGDDPMLTGLTLPVRTLSVGVENRECDFFASNIRQDAFGTEFTAILPEGRREVCYISQLGTHNVRAAMFGIAAAYIFGIDPTIAKNGMAAFTGAKMRQNIYRVGGVTFIEDCYNASPESMRAAIDVGASLDKKRFIALLGDMKELGNDTEKLHYGVGEYAARMGADTVFSYGELAERISDGAADNGCKTVRIKSGDPAEAAELLLDTIEDGDVILFKASRAMRAEKIIDILKERLRTGDNE